MFEPRLRCTVSAGRTVFPQRSCKPSGSWIRHNYSAQVWRPDGGTTVKIWCLTIYGEGGQRKEQSSLLPSAAEPGRKWALNLAFACKLPCTKVLQAELITPHFIDEGTELRRGPAARSCAGTETQSLACTATRSLEVPHASSPNSGSFKCLMSHLLRFVVFAFLFGTDKK